MKVRKLFNYLTSTPGFGHDIGIGNRMGNCNVSIHTDGNLKSCTVY